jgi:hypothetical protein
MESTRKISLYEIAIVVLLVLFLGSSDLIYPFGKDQGEFAYIASAYLKGETVYKEVFNTKPPLTHILNALALKLFGHSMLSIRLFDLLWQCATAVVILLITNLFYERRYIGVLSALLYGFYYFDVDYWHSAQTDGFINLPISLSLLIFLFAREKDKPLLWILSGIFLGISVLLKYPVGIFLLLFVLFILLPISKQNKTHSLYILGGFCIPLLINLLSLAVDNSLRSFFYTQYNFITRYSLGQSGADNYFDYVIHLIVRSTKHYRRQYLPGKALNWAYILAPFIIAGELVYAFNKRPARALMILWWVAAVMHLVVQNRYHRYHRLPIYAPLSIIASHLFFVAYDRARNYTYASLLRAFMVGLIFFLFCAGYFNFGYNHNHKRRNGGVGYYRKHKAVADVILGRKNITSIYKDPRFKFSSGEYSAKITLEVSDYIKRDTTPNDKIFIWGYNPGIYFLSERNCASRFINNFPLYGEFVWKEQFREYFLNEMKENKPKYILVTGREKAPRVTGSRDHSGAAFKKFVEFYDFVYREYERSTIIGDFTIYKRKIPNTPLI